MGAGRKKKKLLLKEKSQPKQTINCSVSARNLRKSDLGAVIFGCKNHTITECKAKQLFGLPFPHFSYVKNVTPGLTLFLFNYDDRKLHGIYEAASPGQLNINPYGWTFNGEESTRFPAQVKTRVRKQCRALREEEFGPIIADNYYEQSLFWFELDRSQARKLIDLFLSSPSSNLAPSLRNTARWNMLLNGMPSSSNEVRAEPKDSVSEDTFDKQHKVVIGHVRWASPYKERNQLHERSYAFELGQLNSNLPHKPWRSLFKESATSDIVMKEKLKTASNKQDSASFPVVNEPNMDWETTSVAPFPKSHDQRFEAFEDTWDVEECEECAKHDKHCEVHQDLWDAEGHEEPHKQDGHFEGSTDTWDTEECGEPMDLKSSCMDSSVPAKTTSSLPFNVFHEHLQIMDPREKGGHFESVASDLHLRQSYDLKTEWENSCEINGSDGGSQHLEAFANTQDVEECEEHAKNNKHFKAPKNIWDAEGYEEPHKQNAHFEGSTDTWDTEECGEPMDLKSSCMDSSVPAKTTSPLPFNVFHEHLKILDPREKGGHHESVDSELHLRESFELKTEWEKSRVTNGSDGGSQPSEVSTDNDEKEMHSDAGVHEGAVSSVALAVGEFMSSDIQSLVAKLIREIGEMKELQLKQNQKINSLEQELVVSKLEMQQMRSHFNMFASRKTSYSSGQFEGIDFESFHGFPEFDDSILIAGGYDGSSWLSALSLYSPSSDFIKPLTQMTFVRSYTSAAKLHGELYLFGGVHGDVWYDTVESYNPRSNRWSIRPPLSKKKGSLAGISMFENLFAIGGGNGVECFSEVEMLDMNIGKWIYTQPMEQKRFAPAVADINGALYVAGGYDGRDYLKSVERFDPREHKWTGVASMNTRRGCHSLVALNGKLYALGGFDGEHMVPTVEVFDPRACSWMIGESMKTARGYSGAAVIGEKIFVIGGVKDIEEIIDTVECYKEGCGWKLTNSEAVGKRCFFSAMVL